MDKVKVLFVCLGNICRSPVGEGIFKQLVDDQNLTNHFFIDSAGTAAYHVGKPADQRMRETAFQHGISLTCKARKLELHDLEEFDYILAMDQSNLRNIKALDVGKTKAKIKLLRDFDPKPEDGNVPDPYYGGIEGFENVFNIVERSSINLLNHIKETHKL